MENPGYEFKETRKDCYLSIYNIKNKKKLIEHVIYCPTPDKENSIKDIVFDKDCPTTIYVLSTMGNIFSCNILDPLNSYHFPSNFEN